MVHPILILNIAKLKKYLANLRLTKLYSNLLGNGLLNYLTISLMTIFLLLTWIMTVFQLSLPCVATIGEAMIAMTSIKTYVLVLKHMQVIKLLITTVMEYGVLTLFLESPIKKFYVATLNNMVLLLWETQQVLISKSLLLT